ncbi:hypothetical protein GQ44DRAFT_780264 [Phaeosphaeriaceae sp. PMI808]|nr:hypothetical protein GQ44DRAFT_780264 [Phaeosphaeriaceae sp. PMI808]
MEPRITLRPVSDTNPTRNHFDSYTKYMIVAAIPFCQRAGILWRDTNLEAFVMSAIELSVLQDLTNSVQGVVWSDKRLLRVSKGKQDATKALAKTHLPYLHDLLNHPKFNVSSSPPDNIIYILQSIMSLVCSLRGPKDTKTFFKELLRSRSSMITSPQFTSGITTYNPDDLINQISQLTEAPPYVLAKALTVAREIASETQYCSPAEWDTMVRDVEEDRRRLCNDMDIAKRELEKMVVVVPMMDHIDENITVFTQEVASPIVLVWERL